MIDMLAIIDFGGSHALNIAHKVRSENVYCEIFPPSVEVSALSRAKGVILAGGQGDAFAPEAELVREGVLFLGVPVLGMGYGARALLRALDGRFVDALLDPHAGRVFFEPESQLFEGLPVIERFFERVDVVELPDGAVATARTEDGVCVAFEAVERSAYGMQFYPEQNDPDGLAILRNFAVDICGCAREWTIPYYVQSTIELARAELPEGEVLMAVSGGVDSTVSAVLMHQAIGARMRYIHIDTGLMRGGETDLIRRVFEDAGMELTLVDASARFLRRLHGVTNPDEKRRVIGEEFVETILHEAQKLGSFSYLAQGTIYMDTVHPYSREVPSNDEWRIKTSIAGRLGAVKVIEPLRSLFKHEVRNVAEAFALPDEIVRRQSFPLSGLAVRCLGEVNQQKIKMLRAAEAIYDAEIRSAGLDKRIWQHFVVLSDIRTASSDGAYEYTAILRAVNRAGSLATPHRMPWDVLERCFSRIKEEVKGINRVLYDVSTNPTTHLEWE